MSYLTIIAAVWGVCAIFAVLFIRGAAQPKLQPVRVQSRDAELAEAAKKFSLPQ
jgi:hypothetical protein